jgi:hypothetical protein
MVAQTALLRTLNTVLAAPRNAPSIALFLDGTVGLLALSSAVVVSKLDLSL